MRPGLSTVPIRRPPTTPPSSAQGRRNDPASRSRKVGDHTDRNPDLDPDHGCGPDLSGDPVPDRHGPPPPGPATEPLGLVSRVGRGGSGSEVSPLQAVLQFVSALWWIRPIHL